MAIWAEPIDLAVQVNINAIVVYDPDTGEPVAGWKSDGAETQEEFWESMPAFLPGETLNLEFTV